MASNSKPKSYIVKKMLRGANIEGGVMHVDRVITRDELPALSNEYIQQLVEWDMLEEVKDGRQVSKK